MSRVSVADLKEREYWTPGEAAKVLGRGARYWVSKFDQQVVSGYQTETGRRYLEANSARAHLRDLSLGFPDVVAPRSRAREIMAQSNAGYAQRKLLAS